MSGIVSVRHVNAGDVVTPGSELYTIIDPSSMRLAASVPSEQIGAVRVGAPVSFQVRGYPDQSFDGRIERISPAADSVTRQVPIFVTIPNKGGRLVAGLFAEGRVTREARRGLVVPLTAVNENGPSPWVMRVRDGKAERVEVKLGLRDDQTERVEIASGVAEGDVLLLGAAQGMTPGTPVTIKNGEKTE
jgi:RND family efflux transporter MFP subunit